jgi:hypothetical protein
MRDGLPQRQVPLRESHLVHFKKDMNTLEHFLRKRPGQEMPGSCEVRGAAEEVGTV